MYQSQLPLRRKVMRLTNAQIKALPQGYLTLIAAPGVGLGIILVSAYGLFDFSHEAYGGMSASGGFLLVTGDYASALTAPWFPDAGILNTAAQRSVIWPLEAYPLQDPLLTDWGNDLSVHAVDPGQMVNQPVKLAYWNGADVAPGAAALTSGDPANTISLDLRYLIVSTSPFGR